MTSNPDGYRMNTPRITHENLDGEVILLDFEVGTYFSLSGSGAAVWEAVGEGATLEQIVSRVSLAYAGDASAIAKSVEALLDQMEAESLVLRAPAAELPPATKVELSEASQAQSAFETPKLEKHTDMQDLLLLDPIHEVEESSGWPNRKTESDS